MVKQNQQGTAPDESLPAEDAFYIPLHELRSKLKTDFDTGLNQKDIQERSQRFGPNFIPRVGTNRLKMYLAPLSNWLIVIYLIVSTALAFLAIFFLPQLWLQVTLWLPLITGNIVVIIVQSIRAENGLTALRALSNPKSTAKRDGKTVVIPSEDLVPGDIVLLKLGDIIPADMRVINSQNLRVNESILTGESNDVEKSQLSKTDKAESSVLSKRNCLFLGTSIVTGNATALVVETGRNTQIGKMAGKLKFGPPEISLRKRINILARNLTFIVLVYLVLSITYSIIALYLAGYLLTAVAIAQVIAKSLITALNIMPVTIPLLVTIVLLAGAVYMVKSNVIIRNLNSIESAGRISVLCTDKTGTITQNKMTAKWVYTPDKNDQEKLYYITSSDSDYQGKIVEMNIAPGFKQAVENPPEHMLSKSVKIEEEPSLEYLLAAALLNNDRPIFDNDQGKTKACQIDTAGRITSDATDIAMLCLFEKAVLEPETYTERFKIVHSWPLDPKSKLITKVFKDTKTDQNVLFIKGATETLLQKCENIKSNQEVFTQELKNHVLERADLFSSLGQRIVSFAFRTLENFNFEDPRERNENSLTYLGLVAIADPPRQGIHSAVKELKCAGIKPVMITGDSLSTAKSIAKEIGLLDENQLCIEGSQIKTLSDKDFLNASVFARTSPDDKKAIVDRYKSLNCVVAMTGDGVNDAQAILAADVGIAMGATGTDVAKQAAGLVLADDSFNSIVTGIREGRGVFEKIQNIVFFYIALSIAEALVFFGASFVREFFILQTWQFTYLAITQLAPSIALVTDKLSSDVMEEKPRTNEGLISGKRRNALIVFALSLSVVLAVAYLLASYDMIPFESNASEYFRSDILGTQTSILYEQAEARTMLLSVAIIAQSALILSLRRLSKPLNKSIKEDRNWSIWPLIVSVPIFHALLMYVPQIQKTISAIGINLEIIPLSPIDWLVVLALGLTPIALLELTKIAQIKKETKTKKIEKVP